MTNHTASLPPPPLFHQPSSSSSSSSSSPSLSSLPDEIVVNSLARISKSQYPSLCSVSRSFYSLLSTPEIYATRALIGATEPRLYLCLRLPIPTHRHRWFTLSINKGELSLQPLKFSLSSSDSCHARLNSTIVAVGSEIYQIGGTLKDKRSKAVFVLDCWTHTWRRGPNLTVARKHAKSCLLDGKIYVIGGCRKRKKPMYWAEVFDLKTQTWNPLGSPSDDNGSHQVLVLGARLYVITKHNERYAYDPKQVRWVLEFGCRGLQLITTRLWCVIDNIVFYEYGEKYWWYDLSCGMWLMVEGLDDLYIKLADNNRTIQLVNYGGKLLVIWREWIDMQHPTRGRRLGILQKRTCCSVIRLEKRLTCLGTQIWGESERLNDVIRVPKPYNNLLGCISVSV